MREQDPFKPRWCTPKRTVKAARELRQPLTPAEAFLWQHLRGNQLDGWHFRRQHPVGRFIVDFFCAKAGLVIEVDGPIHLKQQAYDQERTALLEEERGYHVIRFTNDEVMGDIEGVLARIRKAIQESDYKK